MTLICLLDVRNRVYQEELKSILNSNIVTQEMALDVR